MWTVPKSIAKPRLRSPRQSREGNAGGGPMRSTATRVHGVEGVIAANAALSEAAAAIRQCARCQSHHYKQRTIWSDPHA